MSDVEHARRTARGFYPERRLKHESTLDRALATAVGHLRRLQTGRHSRMHRIVEDVAAVSGDLGSLSDEELRWQVDALRPLLRSKGFRRDLVARAFALIREVAGRRTGMRPFDVQLMGGWTLLQGMVSEMGTGEGKTLTATLPACTVALAGIPVHVITVNDYLARRDASWMKPVYESLGLRVGVVTGDVGPDRRREAYAADVTYCTNKELVFDYLRDRLELGRRPAPIRMRVERLAGDESPLDRLRLRGLFFGLVDEADSVLIDEARTPLIISGRGDNSYEAEIYRQAIALSEALESDRDYVVDFPRRQVRLTDEGRERLAPLGEEAGGIWTGTMRREELIHKALTARHLFHRDKQYVVRDGRIGIVDEYTGRVMPGRSWEGGLHQMIETKECCDVTTQTEILARISYQRFFRRYLALAGMTGTAREAAAELWSVYRLRVARVPTHRPTRRVLLAPRIHRDADAKWDAVVDRVQGLHERGRPVLIGTRTVADSEILADRMRAASLECRVLNALQDRDEAEIIAEAGLHGRITVATNMAGRGTDIKLGPGVEELGGLHVIATEFHDAGRIDRQLFGRCGRQGDPGSAESIVSLEDELLDAHPTRLFGFLGPSRIDPRGRLGRWLARRLFRRTQRAAERRNRRIRRELLRIDETTDRALAFSGAGE
jgi:preprotein translocase subunit SecA